MQDRLHEAPPDVVALTDEQLDRLAAAVFADPKPCGGCAQAEHRDCDGLDDNADVCPCAAAGHGP